MTTQVAGSSGSGWSPLLRMQDQLQRAVSKGTVKTEDQDALSAALNDIGASFQAGTTATAASGQSPRSKIDDLIGGEVSSGKLTTDQASELKSVFAQAAQRAHGHHGPPPSSQGDDSDDGDDSLTSVGPTSLVDFIKKLEAAITDSVSATTGPGATQTASASNDNSATASSGDPSQIMLGFLRKLETALGSDNTYSPGGASSSASNAQGVLVNAMA